MKILYADAWMVDALTAAGLPRTALLDIPALLNTLSVDDVAFYIDTNRNLNGFLPKEVVSSFQPATFIQLNSTDDRQMRRVHDALQGRAIKKSTAVPADAKNTGKMLTCDLLDADTILFRYIDSVGDTSPLHRVLHLSERIIRQLYTMLSFEHLSVLPVVRMYLENRQTLLTTPVSG